MLCYILSEVQVGPQYPVRSSNASGLQKKGSGFNVALSVQGDCCFPALGHLLGKEPVSVQHSWEGGLRDVRRGGTVGKCITPPKKKQ